jgi:adenine-specific DNA-methyltransferase
MEELYKGSLTIEKRRYIGCKAKLIDWIFNIIQQEAPGLRTFCDIFAGTAVVANAAINLYEKVILNDFLYSNNVIYKAFFGEGDYEENKIKQIIEEFNSIKDEEIIDNYFSDSFGNKYFDYVTAKRIGYIREKIEERRIYLTDKEYNILLATLIYNIDKLANTLGHYEAYIKKDIPVKKMVLVPIYVRSLANVEIYREDSNKLARHIEADIVYLDPPYNSRQYSRFYHLYETLVKWDKAELFGTAMKPKCENMSEYCRTNAVKAFEDLILNIKAKYIVVSYNNTYSPKSSSSTNKIKQEDIVDILNKRGPTKIYEHKHQFFNAGKTEFDNHKEFLFVTKINEE